MTQNSEAKEHVQPLNILAPETIMTLEDAALRGNLWYVC